MGVLVVSLDKVSPFFEGWSVYTSKFPASAQINSKYSRSSLPHLPTCISNGRTPARPSSLTGGAPATRRLSPTPTAGRTLGWASPPSTAPTRARCLAWQGARPSLCLCLPVCLSWTTGRACLSSAEWQARAPAPGPARR